MHSYRGERKETLELCDMFFTNLGHFMFETIVANHAQTPTTVTHTAAQSR